MSLLVICASLSSRCSPLVRFLQSKSSCIRCDEPCSRSSCARRVTRGFVVAFSWRRWTRIGRTPYSGTTSPSSQECKMMTLTRKLSQSTSPPSAGCSSPGVSLTDCSGCVSRLPPLPLVSLSVSSTGTPPTKPNPGICLFKRLMMGLRRSGFNGKPASLLSLISRTRFDLSLSCVPFCRQESIHFSCPSERATYFPLLCCGQCQ